jgi:D-alanyl-D-alanine carboxypeptidase/D-alanyl-D-alanine-endopeptidase (penicillin-binding protein 4)
MIAHAFAVPLFAIVVQLPAVAMDTYLADLHAGDAPFDRRLARVAEDSLGTPYAGGPLGEGPKGRHDTDPLIDLGRVDCVTFVEQTLALAAESDYDAAFDLLQHIRYRGGTVDYAARNHFLIADWVANNAFAKEVTGDLGVPVETVERTISRSAFFRRVGADDVGQGLPDEEIALAVIPGDRVADALEHAPSPSLVVFVGKVDWLFALHCGLFIRDDGDGVLYHASSEAGEVVAVDPAAYLAGKDRYIGVAVYALEEPGE